MPHFNPQLQQFHLVLFSLSFEQISGSQATCKSLAIILCMMDDNRVKSNTELKGKVIKSRG